MTHLEAFRMPARWQAPLALACLLAVSGCSRAPQVAPANRRLIESLRTAVSAQRADWLAENTKVIEERHQAGSLSGPEYDALTAIIAAASSGNWPSAEKQVRRLAAAQRVTDEDIARLKRERTGEKR